MNRELNKIFDVKTREARRRILDKFDISNEDKNEVLNKIEEGGGGSEGDSNVEYLDLSGLDVINTNSKYSIIPNYAISIKLENEGYIAFTPSSMYESSVSLGAAILAVAIDLSLPTNAFRSDVVTTNDYFLTLPSSFAFSQSEIDAIPRITKEEFYSLETPE